MKTPTHIAFIMDGNGRWAKKRMLPRSFGHRKGTENIIEIVRAAKGLGVKYLTFYAFSTENFKRPAKEVQFLMSLIGEFFEKEMKHLLEEGVCLKVIGDISQFPEEARKYLDNAMVSSSGNSEVYVNIALGYGSRAEIVDAVNRIILDGHKSVDEKLISEYLYTAGMPDPDLMIRTSGEQRLSNYLLYQLAYAEFIFTDVLWPDFGKADLEKALRQYAGRDRRYGGIKE